VSDLTYGFIEQLESRLGYPVRWSGYAHHDTPNPHAHVVLGTIRLDERSTARAIQDAAHDAYAAIREQQRAYSRNVEQLRE
jgi:hypothetical protein